MPVTDIKQHVFDRYAIPVFETDVGNFVALQPIAYLLGMSINGLLESDLHDAIFAHCPQQLMTAQIHDDSGDYPIDRDVIPLDMSVVEVILAKSRSPRVQRLRRFLIDVVLPAHQQNATRLLMQRLKAVAVYSVSCSGFARSHASFLRHWQSYSFRITRSLAH